MLLNNECILQVYDSSAVKEQVAVCVFRTCVIKCHVCAENELLSCCYCCVNKYNTDYVCLESVLSDLSPNLHFFVLHCRLTLNE